MLIIIVNIAMNVIPSVYSTEGITMHLFFLVLFFLFFSQFATRLSCIRPKDINYHLHITFIYTCTRFAYIPSSSSLLLYSYCHDNRRIDAIKHIIHTLSIAYSMHCRFVCNSTSGSSSANFWVTFGFQFTRPGQARPGPVIPTAYTHT